MEFAFGLLPLSLIIGWLVLWVWRLVDIRLFSPEARREAGAVGGRCSAVLRNAFYLGSVRGKLQDSEAQLATSRHRRTVLRRALLA